MKLTDEEKHDFIADITGHLLEEINRGNEVFIVLSFRHDKERDSMSVTNSVVMTGKTVSDERMADKAHEIVRNFMDANAPRWSQ